MRISIYKAAFTYKSEERRKRGRRSANKTTKKDGRGAIFCAAAEANPAVCSFVSFYLAGRMKRPPGLPTISPSFAVVLPRRIVMTGLPVSRMPS